MLYNLVVGVRSLIINLILLFIIKIFIMIQTIKELRVEIDKLYQLTAELKPILIGFTPFDSPEVDQTAKSLILAKMWLGNLLGELGSKNPYSTGKKELKDIEPTADTADRDVKAVYDGSWNNESHIERVDWLRSEIQKVIDEVYKILEINSRTRLTGENAWRYLCEAKMWLGFEFQRIREEKT